MATIGGVLFTLLVAAFSRLWAEEIGALLSAVVCRIIKVAVSIVPEEKRERYEEEWASHICETPGSISQLVHSLGFVIAAFITCSDCKYEKQLNEWSEVVR